MARRSPRCAIDDEQQRPVRRQSAGHQVAQQAAGDGSGLGGAFAQAQHVFPARRVDPQRNHHAMVPEDLAIDADHPQGPDRPSGRPRNASRRFVDSATNRRETALLDVARSVTSTGTGSNVPAYRRLVINANYFGRALPHLICYRATIVASQFLLPKEATMSTISPGTRQELVTAVADR